MLISSKIISTCLDPASAIGAEMFSWLLHVARLHMLDAKQLMDTSLQGVNSS